MTFKFIEPSIFPLSLFVIFTYFRFILSRDISSLIVFSVLFILFVVAFPFIFTIKVQSVFFIVLRSSSFTDREWSLLLLCPANFVLGCATFFLQKRNPHFRYWMTQYAKFSSFWFRVLQEERKETDQILDTERFRVREFSCLHIRHLTGWVYRRKTRRTKQRQYLV